jgi:hypothetical protein
MARAWWLAAGLVASGCCWGGGSAAPREATLAFAEARAAHPTHLLVHGPSPQPYDDRVPSEVRVVRYTSGALELAAWIAVPPGPDAPPRPVFVYAHGGFAIGAEDFDDVRAAYDAGFIVFMPILRGENGNPGDYELAFGEVDDLRASIAFVRTFPGVDAQHIALIGHSAGGMVASLAALAPDLPVELTASIGGIYSPERVCAISAGEVFDSNDPEECRLRSLLPFAAQLPRVHRAYLGLHDIGIRQQMGDIQRAVASSNGRLVVIDVPGDHRGSIAPAVADFIAVIHAAR